MGYRNVVTLLQSGNVMFTSPESNKSNLKSTIESGLEKRFHYPAKVIVKDIPSIKKIINKYPFDSSTTEDQHYVAFLSQDVVEEMMESAQLNERIEQIAPGNMVIYWKAKKGMFPMVEFPKLLSKAKYKDLNTVRNIKTLQKLLQ